jgi:hypothetical protein
MKENVLRNKPLWEIPIELKVKYPEIRLFVILLYCRKYSIYHDYCTNCLDYGFNGLMIETHCCRIKLLAMRTTNYSAQLYNMLHSLIFKSLTIHLMKNYFASKEFIHDMIPPCRTFSKTDACVTKLLQLKPL